MKIQDLLCENAVLAYRDLDATQSAVLTRIANLVSKGEYDPDTASPREIAIMDQLVDFGLLDSMSMEPTEAGLRVANLSKKYGSHDARDMSRRQQALGTKDFGDRQRYTDVGDIGDNITNDDEVAPVKLKSLTDVRQEYN